MRASYKIAVAAAVTVCLLSAGVEMWRARRTARLEAEIGSARAQADAKAAESAKQEMQAAEYRAKNEYLEAKIVEIRAIARRQDEELEKLSAAAGDARADVERRRRIRSVAVTTEELCRKLGELGHECD